METKYTKHYYIEGQRITSKIGGGLKPAIAKFDLPACDPITSSSYSDISSDLLKMYHRADECMKTDPGFLTYAEAIESIHNLREEDETEKELYFYHSDHIGSSSFITDADGIASQHLQYLPFGELFAEQRTTANYYTPYKFSGKEKDEETSYSFPIAIGIGARYHMSDVSVWLSVDPMRDKYPSMSPFNYCHWNPAISGTHGWEGHLNHFHVQNFNQNFINHSPVKEKEHDCVFQY